MSPADTWKIVVLFILLLLSSFFSSAETALTSVSKIQIRTLVQEGNKKAELVEKLITNPSKMLSAILIGNNIANLSASSLTTSLVSKFGGAYVGIATGVLTFIVLIFGEITPKTMATVKALKLSCRIAPIINFLTVVLTPIIVLVNFISKYILKIFGVDMNAAKLNITENELRTVVDVSSEAGVIENDEREMITNVVDFGDALAKDVMVPRVDMKFASVDMDYNQLMHAFKEDQYSRLPVYENDIDHIIGVVYLKDVFFAGSEPSKFELKKHIRKAYFTYEYKNTSELLKEMRRRSLTMAIIIDEYGATAGLITMEDLIEEIVGDIKDEYDVDEADNVRKIGKYEYLAQGTARLDEVNEVTGLSLESEEYESIAGHVINLLGHLPGPGEMVRSGHVQYVVSKVIDKRIDEVKIIFDKGFVPGKDELEEDVENSGGKG